MVSLYQYDRADDLTIKTATSAVELYAGDSATVSARAILGETNELTWTSANESIATVKDGVITGVAEGETTITITTVDTNKAGEHVTKDIAVTVTNVTLPVSFAKAWPTLLEAIEQAKPDIVIATGLKRTSRGILLERCATNLMDAAKPDADNVIPPRRPIDPEGPAAYWTRLPLRSILHDFAKHEIPAALSSDAGTFVCNSLFYHLLNWSAGQERRILSGFVSLPIVNGRPHERGLSIEQQTAAVDDVLRESVRYFLQPSSSDILLG